MAEVVSDGADKHKAPPMIPNIPPIAPSIPPIKIIEDKSPIIPATSKMTASLTSINMMPQTMSNKTPRMIIKLRKGGIHLAPIKAERTIKLKSKPTKSNAPPTMESTRPVSRVPIQKHLVLQQNLAFYNKKLSASTFFYTICFKVYNYKET